MTESKTTSAVEQWRPKIGPIVLWAVGVVLAVCAFEWSLITYIKPQRENQATKMQLIADRRDDPVAWKGMAQELEQKGDLIEAERAYRKAIELQPDYKDALLKLGNLLKKQAKSTEAEAAFRRANELKSDPEK